MDYLIKHNDAESRFEWTKNEYTAVLEYKIRDKEITFTHTGVPKELEGQGIGSMLVKSGLDYAIQNGLKIVPLCPFVKSYIDKHKEYQK